MKNIVVFGATGTLGLYFVDYLASMLDSREWHVVATGRRELGYFQRYGSMVDYVSLNIADSDSFTALPQNDVYAVVHFAGALPAYMEGYDPYAYVNSNVLGTLNVLEYARISGADRVVYTQTISDYNGYFNELQELQDDMPRRLPWVGDHSVYAITKTCAEDLCWNYQAEYGIKCFAFRLPNIYCYMPEVKTLYHDGKVARSSYRYMIDRALKGETLEVWGDPNKVIDIIYVKDFCQEVFKALMCNRSQGGIYNVGTGVGTSIGEWVRAIADVFNPSDAKSEIIMYPEKPDCVDYYMNVDKAKRELGYEPEYDVRAMLEDYKTEMEAKRFKDFFVERYGSCE